MTQSRDVQLPDDLASYQDQRPDVRQRRELGIDGSEMELRIVSILVRENFSDDEILVYFNAHQLPRHTEEKNQSWLFSLIRTARASRDAYLETKTESRRYRDEDEVEGQQQQTTRVIEIEHNRRIYGFGQLPHLVLARRREQEDSGDTPILTRWYEEIMEISAELITEPVSLSTARRLATALRDKKYVQTERVDGKRQRVLLTEKGRRSASRTKGGWGRFVGLKSLSHVSVDVEVEELHDLNPMSGRSLWTADIAPDPRSRARAKLSPAKRRESDADEARRRRIVYERRRERINGWFRLNFMGNKVRYMQIISPLEEWAGGQVWPQLMVGFDAFDLPLFLTVAATDDDPIRALLPGGWAPREQWFAGAVELEANADGFRVAEWVDEDGLAHPRVGIIAQSAYNFFQPLLHADPMGRVIEVRGTKTLKKRWYSFSDAGDALSLAFEFDIDAFLDALSGQELVDQVCNTPTGWFHMPLKRQRLIHWLTVRAKSRRKDRRDVS
jgi:hypothetical protein